MQNDLSSKEFKQALIEMVQLYGSKKWANVARGLKNIYGYDIGNKEALAKWNVLNPDRNHIQFNQEQNIEFWNVIFFCKGDYYEIIQHYMTKKQCKYQKQDILAKIEYLFRSCMKELLRIGEFKKYWRTVGKFRPATYRHIIELNFINDEKGDQEFERVQKNMIILTKLCTSILEVRNEQEKIKKLVEELRIEDFNQMINDAALLNILVKIRFSVTNQKKFKKQTEKHEKRLIECQQNTYKSTNIQIKEIDSDDSDCQHFPEFYNKQALITNLQTSNQESYVQPYLLNQLTQEQVDDLLSSYLYQRLFDDNSKNFFNFYNTASLNKTTDLQQFSVKMNSEPSILNKKIRIEQANKGMKTIRGRIKDGKEIFHNSKTIMFEHQDEPENEKQEFLIYKKKMGID